MAKLAVLFLLIALHAAHANQNEEPSQLEEIKEKIEAITDDRQKEKFEREYGLNFYRHRPNYFITGEPDTKIQFSFRIQIIREKDWYLGYTQSMFWRLDQDSWPFSDVNFNPEFFYIWHMNEGILKGVDIGFYEHRSNGEDGASSRSWNRSYVNFRTEFQWSRLPVLWETKLFALYHLDENNPEMRDILGFIELSLTVKDFLQDWFRDAEAQLRLLPGGKWDLKNMQGHQEFNFRFRLPIRHVEPYFFLQIYNGLNESMLEHLSRRTAYRVGISI